VVGVGLVNLVIFPELLPFGFCGESFVKTREIRNSYSHVENNRRIIV
jgi:predicted amidohydrolase